MTPEVSPEDARGALLLEYATILWNTCEAVLTISLGIAAGSLALIGFGSDSIIEIFASAVVIWHLRLPSRKHRDNYSGRALRIMAALLLLLAIALTVAAVNDLQSERRADESIFGIAYLGVTAIVMFVLAGAKHRLAKRTHSAPMRAEATMTFLDGILSIATLTGLALNAALGWWWADPGAALLVAVAALNEARETWDEASSEE